MLFEKLESFVREARQAGVVKAIIVDGSFITSKPDPNDIDLIVVVNRKVDFSEELRPADYNVLSRKRVRRGYGFDAFYMEEDSPEYKEMVSFFQRVKYDPQLFKGLLRVIL